MTFLGTLNLYSSASHFILENAKHGVVLRVGRKLLQVVGSILILILTISTYTNNWLQFSPCSVNFELKYVQLYFISYWVFHKLLILAVK